MIITIDGPAGSGKSTAARKLAARLELPYLDTGAMYRAIAYQAIRGGVDLNDPEAVVVMTRNLDLVVDCGPTHTRVKVDGHDVSEAIRGMAVSAVSATIARLPGIRQLLVKKQREIGAELKSLVSEGRDQGSVVFPEANLKFVLDASLERRAQRRYDELVADGEDADLEQVKESLAIRDRSDAVEWAPLLEPGAAVRIDTSRLTIGQVVQRLLAHIAQLTGRPIGTTVYTSP
ncbi:MAG: (d)CMP kinase [Planctomycetota bacterium]